MGRSPEAGTTTLLPGRPTQAVTTPNNEEYCIDAITE
jgi:hypothetical protein